MKTKPAQLMNTYRAIVPVLLLFLFSLVLDAGAQNFQRKVFQLDFANADELGRITNSVIVPTGETWEIAQFYGNSAWYINIQILIDGVEAGGVDGDIDNRVWTQDDSSLFIHSAKYPAPIVVGPATLNLVSHSFSGDQGKGVLIYRVITETGPNPTPSNTVVIPSDAAGPVEIILESSVDLVNWTRAEPGEYGASTEKRFFRLRAVAKP